MVDALIGVKKVKGRSYKKDFDNLCSAANGVPSGCAIFAVNFNGGDNRDISDYFEQVRHLFYHNTLTLWTILTNYDCLLYIQPSVTPAYSNTLYASKVMTALETNTPTSLIQTYYSCVLAPWPAFLQAVGVGTASASFFVFIGFACYIFVLIQTLNACFAARIPSKSRMVSKLCFYSRHFFFIILARNLWRMYFYFMFNIFTLFA